MESSPEVIVESLNSIKAILDVSFWDSLEFQISMGVGLVSLILSGVAAFQARAAKLEAKKAGQVVKTQIVAVELSEIGQWFVKLHPEIRYEEARDNTTAVIRKIIKYVAPYATESNPEIKKIYKDLSVLFVEFHSALDGVRPLKANDFKAKDGSVYYAIERVYSNISYKVAELVGYFDKILEDR